MCVNTYKYICLSLHRTYSHGLCTIDECVYDMCVHNMCIHQSFVAECTLVLFLVLPLLIFMCVCVYIYLYVYIYMYIYMYIYAYTYIYTYTNSHIFASLSTGFTFMVSGLLISVYIILVARSFVHCLESDQEGLAGSDSLAQVDVYIATHCNTLQHAATHCNTLQHTRAVLRLVKKGWRAMTLSRR